MYLNLGFILLQVSISFCNWLWPSTYTSSNLISLMTYLKHLKFFQVGAIHHLFIELFHVLLSLLSEVMRPLEQVPLCLLSRKHVLGSCDLKLLLHVVSAILASLDVWLFLSEHWLHLDYCVPTTHTVILVTIQGSNPREQVVSLFVWIQLEIELSSSGIILT